MLNAAKALLAPGNLNVIQRDITPAARALPSWTFKVSNDRNHQAARRAAFER